ncbi:MAG: hypothetical protein ACWGMZ_11805 [Thermoguttaceae bacterium]
MMRNLFCVVIILISMLVILIANAADLQAAGRESARGDLFYNFYVSPVGYPSVGAQLYPCPRPAPQVVGRTYITYQPLMPHEFLYHHHRRYKSYHSDTGTTRVNVWWH